MPTPLSSSKRSQGPAAYGVDRLGSLPEPLLHFVMSFLPMPEVVRTSLLSSRWRYLWASMPFITLDHKDFVNDDDVDDDEWQMVDQNRMKKFGDQLLLLRDGTLPLDEARIFLDCHFYEKSCTWIRHVIRHKARLLHVYGPGDTEVMFDNRAMLPSPHLKTIRLQTVDLDDGFFRALNFDFPVLEQLELEYCNVYGVRQKISSRSLKTIRISCCHLYGDLEICAPNLNHLSILDPTFEKGCVIVTRDLYSLVIASVSLRSRVNGNRDKIVNHGILEGLSHVTALELHAPLPEGSTHGRGLQTCPVVFGNLTSLVLGEWCMASTFAPLLLILRRSPKLKNLTFMLRTEQRGECKDVERNLSPREEPSLDGYPRIKRTVIYCGKDDPRVSALVKVLLPIVIPGGEISIKGY